MTKKQVLFWRFILVFIVFLGIYFMNPNIFQIRKNEIIEKEIELDIRPNDFYKKIKN